VQLIKKLSYENIQLAANTQSFYGNNDPYNKTSLSQENNIMKQYWRLVK